MTKSQQKEAVRLIHKMATRIKLSHSGWWEAYAAKTEREIVELSNELRGIKEAC